MSHNSDMIKLVKLLEGKNKFAGEEVGQKPGDQVRGTDRAEVDGTEHPFKGRLVGEDTTLEDVLSKKYQDFKDVQAKEKEEKRKEKLEDEKDELDESNDPQSRKLGRIIGRIYNEIYDMGDDALDYLNDRAAVWAELWDRYEGDIDSIIAEEDPVTLGKAALELKDILNDLRSDQGVAEGLPQTLRKVVPGYAKREIDKKMDAGKFGKTDADKDANFQRYKKIQDKIKEQGVAEGDKNPHTSALGKALYRDLSKEKKASPAQVKRNQERWAQRQKAKAEQPPTKGMSNAEKVDKGWRNPNVDEVSDATLTSYLTKVDADSQKHDRDPTKRSAEKRNKSVAGFSRAFNKLDARKNVKEGAYEDGVRDGIRGEPNRRASSIYGPSTGEYDRGFRDGLQQGKEQQQARLAQAKADEAPYEKMSNDELIQLRKEIQQRTTERQKIYSKLRGADYSFDFKRHTPPNHKELKQQGEADNKAWHIINQVLGSRGVNVDRLREGVVEAANPTDAVTMDVPLMIRLFEYAREDAQTDMDLHDVSERLIKMSGAGRTLTMADYDAIVGQATEQQVNEFGADGSAVGSMASARANQAALSTKPSPVNPNGGTQANTAPTASTVSTSPKPGQQDLTPDEQDALEKIKANAGLKSQYDRLLKQAQGGV